MVHAVALPLPGSVPCMPVFPRQIAYDRLVPLSCVSLTGSGVSPGSLLQDGIVQRKIGHQSFQSGVFLLQLSQPLSLFYTYSAVLSTPAIIGLFGDADFSAGLTDCATLADQYFSLAELIDDLLWFELYSGQ